MAKGLNVKRGVDKKGLNEKHAAYVLITCAEPSLDGKMQVELTYEGDPILASYLLENAQKFIDDDEGNQSQGASLR